MGYKKTEVIEIIPQWKQIYLKYDFLKNFISLLQIKLSQKQQQQQKLNTIMRRRNKQLNRLNYSNPGSMTLYESQDAQKLINQLNSQIKDINIVFFNAFEAQSAICIEFIKYKYEQVQYRHLMSLHYVNVATQQQIKDILIPYIQYNYIESIYISRFYQRVQQAQRKLLSKHERYTKKGLPVHLKMIYPQIKQTIRNLDNLTNQIQSVYVYRTDPYAQNHPQRVAREKRDFLRKLVTNVETPHHQVFTSGVFFGIFLAVAIFMTLLLAYKKKSVETDPIFNRDFPTWRGIALIILYMWTQGANLYIYQQYKVSHYLVFDFNEHHRSTSTRIFKLAGVFSTLYVILFSVYTLNLGEVIYLKLFHQRYLVLTIWVIFGLFMFNPFRIFYYNTRRFILRNFIRLPGFLCFPIPFIYTFTVSQLLTLIVPFQDLVYTVCYFTKMDFQVVSKNNPCKGPAKDIRFVFLMILLSWKSLQFVKHAIEKGKFLFSNQFYLIIRYIFLMLTAISSRIYKNGDNHVFYAWLAFAILSSGYSHWMDISNDWDLLHKDSKYFLLRNRINYPQKYYYYIMVTDAFLRFTWTITLSPNIADKYFGSPQLLRLTTGGLQIFRRGNWNTGRIQKGHLRNCDQFKAIPNIRATYQKQIRKRLQQNMIQLRPLKSKDSNGEYKAPDMEKNMKNIRKKVTELEIKQKQYEKQLSNRIKETDNLLQKLRQIQS